MCIHPKSSFIRKGPDLSTLNITMTVFCDRYFLANQHFDKRFLRVEFRSKKSKIKVGDMTVGEFVARIKPANLIHKNYGVGQKTVQKIKVKLEPLGIVWE